MSIYDKFRIIENHVNLENSKNIVSKIDNYFENFFNSDMKVLASDYINQIIWFDKIKMEDCYINCAYHLQNHLIQIRNNMRIFIKKGKFDLNHLNKFLKSCINKLTYLNNIIKSDNIKSDNAKSDNVKSDNVKSDNNVIIKEGIKQLTNLIISDSFILIFIEEHIASLNNGSISEIQTLVTIVKQLSKYDNFEIFNKIIMTFANIFIKQIIDIEEPPLPENIKRIQKLNDTLKYCKKVKEYLKFMSNDIDRINQQFYIIIIENLSGIIEYNSLDEIEYVLENTLSNINEMNTETTFDGKEESLNIISTKIINLIDRSQKSQNNDDIFKIIKVLDFVNTTVNRSPHKEIINQKISDTLCSEELVENIQTNIDLLIRNNNEKDVRMILNFVSNIKNKDIFIANYYQKLIKRLVEKVYNFKINNIIPKEYINMEKQLLCLIKTKFGDKLIYKLNKVIIDTEVSFEDNCDFNKKLKSDSDSDSDLNLKSDNFINKMTVITTSFNNWDVNQEEGLVNNKMVKLLSNTQLGTHLQYYNEYYEFKYLDKRILNWFPHFGEVNITYIGKEINMLPIQFMVIELFNNVSNLPIKEVIASHFFSNYTSKFTHDIIESLISSKLFTIENDLMIITLVDNFTTDLIQVFFNISDYTNIWQQLRENEIVLSREEIVCANINNLIKTQSMTDSQLFDSLVKVIKVFELDDIIFKKSLNYMCKMDYINLNGDLYEKIIY